jgi:thiosulfate/3-mercaptopyruvate sulfurtransferase
VIDLEQMPLVNTGWLAGHLDAVRVVDARWRGSRTPGAARSRRLFAQGHIPGAVPVDWQHDLAYTDAAGVRDRLLPPDRFARLMQALGINPQTPIVAYADRDYSGATRVWWALRYYGHRSVAVLDGGWDRWQADQPDRIETGEWLGGAEGQEGPEEQQDGLSPSAFSPQPALLATADEIQQALDRGDARVRLVDTRPVEQYEGRAVWTPLGSRHLAAGDDAIDIGARGPMRAGHIPGAIHLNSSLNLDPATWTYRPREELRARALEAGLRPDQRIITYCGVGISAALGLFALHLAGFENLALYDGSWDEWGTDPARPVERT